MGECKRCATHSYQRQMEVSCQLHTNAVITTQNEIFITSEEEAVCAPEKV